MSRPISIGTLGLTMSISKCMKDPSGVGILTGIAPKLAKTPSPNLNAFFDGLGLNRTPTISQYAFACCFPTTDCWAPESRQAPWNGVLRVDLG